MLRYDAVGSDDRALAADAEAFANDLEKLYDRLCEIRDQAEGSLHRMYEVACERFGGFAESCAWCAEDDGMSGLNDITRSLGIWLDQIWDGLERMAGDEAAENHDKDGGSR